MEKEAKKEDKQKYTLALLMENSIALQRVLTDAALSIKQLNEKLETLLGLFEDAAQNFKDKKPDEKDKELSNKLNEISEQNRIIAKGVMLLEQAVRKEKEQTEQPFKPKPLSEFSL